MFTVSIIIPAYNEADQIAQTLQNIYAATKGEAVEIIIIDGGSTDDTVKLARAAGAKVIASERKGRAAQMNAGSSTASSGIFFFLHADSVPPKQLIDKINAAVEAGYSSGCFRLKFDYNHWFLKANSWFTRFDVNAVRFGDQGLFVTRKVFEQVGGFDEELMIMEDQEIIHRLKKAGRFIVLKDAVTTSARKYHDNGIYRMQGIFFIIWSLYYLGLSQHKLKIIYRKLIKKSKL